VITRIIIITVDNNLKDGLKLGALLG
jgi:hypothetical protein